MENMNVLQLNIGFNNNPYTFEKITEVLVSAFGGEIVGTLEHMGEYEGNPEPTLVAKIITAEEYTDAYITVSTMASMFTQECIAMKFNDKGTLVYNVDFEGEQYTFDAEYFIEF
jgi:hypothetical protein